MARALVGAVTDREFPAVRPRPRWLSPVPFLAGLALAGLAVALLLKPWAPMPVPAPIAPVPAPTQPAPVEVKPTPSNFTRFIKSIRTGVQDQPDFARGAEVQKVLDACFVSEAKKRPVLI